MSEDARVAAYGKVIWETSRADEGTISATGANIVARAVMTVADAEQAELLTERDAFFGKALEFKRKRIEALARAESAERARDAALAEVTELRDRLGRVEALADEWKRTRCGVTSPGLRKSVDELRAIGLAIKAANDETDRRDYAAFLNRETGSALASPVTGDTEDASPAAEDEQPCGCAYDKCPRCGWQAIANTGICDHCGWGAASPTEQATEGGA